MSSWPYWTEPTSLSCFHKHTNLFIYWYYHSTCDWICGLRRRILDCILDRIGTGLDKIRIYLILCRVDGRAPLYVMLHSCNKQNTFELSRLSCCFNLLLWNQTLKQIILDKNKKVRKMVLLAAAVCTRSGKALISRQFIEMSRARIEGLLSAFPKLMNSDSKGTFNLPKAPKKLPNKPFLTLNRSL